MKVPRKHAGARKRPGKAKDSETSVNSGIGPSESTSPSDPNTSQVPVQSFPREVVTDSPEQTFGLGQSIAERLTGPAIILLNGDLGAGKTVLAKGIAAGLDIDPADVTSPSFTLINIHDGRLRLYHVDLYRLDSASCASLGLEEIFEDPRGVTVIEWAERMASIPRPVTRVHIEYVTESSRKVLVSADPGTDPAVSACG